MTLSVVFGLAVFILAFILIATEKINKAVVSLIGASLFMVAGIISQEKSFHHEVDWNVIFLLIGMMIIVGITKQTGLFQYIAIKMAKLAKGKPFRIMLYLAIITAVFSAFLDNVTTVLILTPITILIAVELDLSPVPFIISEIIASNVGGTATLIGDPPNIMIGSAAHLSFLDFIINLAPIILFMVFVFGIFAYVIWGRKLKVSNERRARIMEFNENKFIENKTLLIKSLFVLSLVVFGFMFHSVIHLEAASIASALQNISSP
jgi:Na+/H+ antiporter NhaD/arsenite permease-like protein